MLKNSIYTKKKHIQTKLSKQKLYIIILLYYEKYILSYYCNNNFIIVKLNKNCKCLYKSLKCYNILSNSMSYKYKDLIKMKFYHKLVILKTIHGIHTLKTCKQLKIGGKILCII